MIGAVANRVHAVRKLAAGRHAGEDYVTRKREQGPRELITFPRLLRNVKFHHLEAKLP
jgi:hypothetical protein